MMTQHMTWCWFYTWKKIKKK